MDLVTRIQKLPEELERKIWLYVHEINLHKVNQEFLNLTYNMDCRLFVSENDYYGFTPFIKFLYSTETVCRLENKNKTIRKYRFLDGTNVSTTRLLVININAFRKYILRVLPKSCWMKAILQGSDKYLIRYNKFDNIQSSLGKRINFNIIKYYNI